MTNPARISGKRVQRAGSPFIVIRLTRGQIKSLHNQPIKLGPLTAAQWNRALVECFNQSRSVGDQRFKKDFPTLIAFFSAELNPKSRNVDEQLRDSFRLQFTSIFSRQMNKLLEGKMNPLQILAWSMIFMMLKELSLKLYLCDKHQKPYGDIVTKTNQSLKNAQEKFSLSSRVVIS